MLPNASTWNAVTVQSYVFAYKGVIKKALNDKRSYAQSEMRVVFEKWQQEGNAMPTVDEILRCATRAVDLSDGHMKEIFELYWDQFLGKVVGVSDGWGNNMKLYSTIMKATHPEDASKRLFTNSTEAFGVVLFENCCDKWIAHHEWRLRHPGHQVPVKTKQNKDDPELKPCFEARYTESDAGQQTYGSFSPEGLAWYNDFLDQIRTSHRDDNIGNVHQVEETFLEMYRESHGINARSAAEERRNKRSRCMIAAAFTHQREDEMAQQLQDGASDDEDWS